MVSQYFLFGPRSFNILIPQNVEAILSTNFSDYSFGARSQVFAPLLGNGIFTQQGLAARHSRELLRKQFVRAQYQNLDQFQEHVDNLLECLPENGVVDLQPLFFNLTLDTSTALLLGKSVYSLREGLDQNINHRRFGDDFTAALDGLAKRLRIAPWHSLYNPPEFRQACAAVHKFVEDYIQERGLKTGNAPSDDTYGFIHQAAQEAGSEADLRDQLLNVLLAGRDTTACALSWAFRLLVRHPHVLARLRAEVGSVAGQCDKISREQIRNMPYLSSVIQESLRLYPPVPLNIREATATTVLPTGGGANGTSPVLVRKGEVVVFSQYITSRRKSIFGDDANDFKPERWESRTMSDVGWAYIPFSGGARRCLGEDFALMEISYTIVRIIQAFRGIYLPHGVTCEPVGKEKQRLTLVLLSDDGCQVHLSRSG